MSSSPSLPATYAEVPLTEVRVANHPASAPGVTPIQIVTLYRPQAHNAYTVVMAAELVKLWELFDIDDRVKVIVLTGHGKMFCAGADLQNRTRVMTARANDYRDGGGQIGLAIHRCRKPTIGAIQGACVGVGITMCLPMAIRIAYKDAKVGFPFSRRGLVTEAASSFYLPKLIGNAKAMHLITTGAIYPASHKLYDGLFSEVVDTPDGVLPRAVELASEILDNCSTFAWALMRDLIWRPMGSAEEQHLLDSRLLYSMFTSSDNKEGVQSFLEKRKPNITGTLDKEAPEAYPWWTPVDVKSYAKEASLAKL